MNRILCFLVFLAGLAAVAWTGAAYVGANPLALSVTGLIAAVYLAGSMELYRYHRATAGLARAVGALSGPPADLGVWLSPLAPGLRNAVRLRIEGVRTGLPGPSLTPYLVGLLVLLGMLGTFLGMVATLRGTGLALEGATDLQAIRDSLATPVKGLGFAFGTSVAGVASSAMLGLLSALLRRERIVVAQALDTHIATSLRAHSQAHQRDESLRLLQRQADTLPAVVDELKTMMAAMALHHQTLNEQVAANQAAFQASTEVAYARLATSVEQSLRDGIAEGARAAGTAIEPIAQSTLAGLAGQAAAVHDSVTQSLQQQLDAVTARLDGTTKAMSETWNTAVARHQDASAGLAESLRASLNELLASTGERSGVMLDGVSSRLDGLASTVAQTWNEAAAEHRQASAALTQALRQSLDGLVESSGQRSASLLDNVSGRLDGVARTLSQSWGEALARQEQTSQKLADENRTALTAAVAAMAGHATSLVQALDTSHGALRASLAQQEEQRLAAWAGKVDAMTASLRQEWAQAGEQTAARQQEICAALGKAALGITTETQANARATIGEISKLVQTASEAPRAAADVIAEVRQKLSESLVRDNAMLEERSRLLETVGTLLDAVNHASSEQRAAVDALVTTSADMLDRVGKQFTDSVQAQAGQFTETAGAEIRKLTGAVDTQSRQLSEAIGAETGKLATAVETETSKLAGAIGAGTGALAGAVEAGALKLADAVEAGTVKLAGAVETETQALAGRLEADSGRLAQAGELVSGSATEVASLGEAFGAAVRAFGTSASSLESHLQQLEAALEKSMARSDEQLAYYVAQAREVVDLSLMSQKQVLEELQRMSDRKVAEGPEAA